LKSTLNQNRIFQFWKNDPEFYHLAAKAPRSNCILDVSKLLATGVKIRPVSDALRNALEKWQPIAAQHRIDEYDCGKRRLNWALLWRIWVDGPVPLRPDRNCLHFIIKRAKYHAAWQLGFLLVLWTPNHGSAQQVLAPLPPEFAAKTNYNRYSVGN